ncbi:MAG: 1-acyl-sn-glycerol-3-phosphate acyltransferase [Bacteroidales bacterium]|nr:1-acyl-sn-glycerol-3-phosphate acyltransferase [Bacteroidales bacterium]MBQ1882640.1 1-acyl-sn-glycerol-3-phosphate acyltransferase [Bacteroidales bacterium]MBQ2482980.1 1-acyl-sn-glycerol-3-phosphate acyltransferase [Bacteroidales bacterium]MBQ2492230.1 1-acyl-sn-glycerol-3-phosphate acyltransferase [Bacteroidales bacterium]MBQ4196973.1 1-acyl-sn-glycerol-3-phosphate acyltransferase [Bacteroidales bacterium]
MEPINLKEVIKNKNPKLYKWLPGFAIWILGRIIHLKEINQVLAESGHLKGVDFADAVLKYLNDTARVDILHPEKFEEGKKYVFVSNHPLGGLDGLVITSELNKKFGPSKFLVNDILMNVKPMEDLFVPVNNLGTAKGRQVHGVIELYNSDYHVMNFPAGACSRLIKGKIQDLPWKRSFVRQATGSGRYIVPMHFQGRNSGLFYWSSKIRMALGIKSFIEMILLPREMFRQRNKTFVLTIGDPISPEEIASSSDNMQTWCDRIRNLVYSYGNRNSSNR